MSEAIGRYRGAFRIVEGHRWCTVTREERSVGEAVITQKCPRCEATRQLVIQDGVGYLMDAEPIEPCAARWQQLGADGPRVDALVVEGG